MQTAEVVEFPMVRNSKYLGITIDSDRDKTLSEQASKLLKDYYCIEGEDSPQQAFARENQIFFIVHFTQNGTNFQTRDI